MTRPTSPIFIFGARRSGTTMLRLMLACHPEIGIPPEGGFIPELHWRLGPGLQTKAKVPRLLDVFFSLDNAIDWDLDRDCLEARLLDTTPASLRTLVDAIYREYLQRKFPGKSRWGDKTTTHTDHADLIMRLFPEAQMIHIVRDGRAVVASFKNVKHLPASASRAAADWVWCTRLLESVRARLGPSRGLLVHYEDLVQRPAEELSRICRFLGEAYDSQMLDFGERNRSEHLEPARHMAWKALTAGAVTTSRLEAWRDDLTPADLVEFHAVAASTMLRFGYSVERSSLAPIRRTRAIARATRDLAERFARRWARPWVRRYDEYRAKYRSRAPL